MRDYILQMMCGVKCMIFQMMLYRWYWLLNGTVKKIILEIIVSFVNIYVLINKTLIFINMKGCLL